MQGQEEAASQGLSHTLSSSGPLGPGPPTDLVLAGCETPSLAVGLSAHRHRRAAPTPPCPPVLRPPSALIGRSYAQNMVPRDL